MDVLVNLHVGEEGTASMLIFFFCNSLPKALHFLSGENDYRIEATQLIFTTGSNLRECTTFDATDDSILENSEVLSLFLSTDVVHTIQPITVTITDNDSE